MTNSKRNTKHWRGMSDLTIYDAAFWIVHKSDPEQHSSRCQADSEFEQNYLDNPYGEEAVYKFSQQIISAIRSNDIKTTKEHFKNDFFDIKRTYISKSDWISWCRKKRYSYISKLLTDHNDAAASEVTVNSTASQASNADPVEINSRYKPANAVGAKCVKAAIQVEQKTKRYATAKEVMELLQEWADIGAEPDALIASDRKKLSVIWQTEKRVEKSFSLEACGKVLKKFNDGRKPLTIEPLDRN